ncbi:hypothetical protein SAMN05216341_10830 [Leuconostocaceae bacterium R-53105]|uniref:Uncharacterized protein n=2 Tax=Convivina TaxID=1697027 RepID=A0A2U1D678_9LACO|nr:hypothetical protein [Convivina intestini]PVY83099.1 hypothetical protein C7384_10947 [Convivina intestini]CAH1856191.1 hypothetical protein LMG032447_01252 [Convivina sp. LMG 32447]CAH1856646.1 hypothetical protein R077811_01300 [Convivina intestini]SDB97794.1 hypothetical protein SAMN05216341_10830 [Leuconostocaceae bacterium R-53105]
MKLIEDYPKLNIKRLELSKYYQPSSVTWHDKSIAIATTSPNYGGVRHWLVCPVCQQRRTALYYVSHSVTCRQCGNLYYTYQDNKANRDIICKALALDIQLNKQLRAINPVECNILPPNYIGYINVSKPKGMHWTTYERKLGKVHQLIDELSTILGVYKRLRKQHGNEIAKQLDKAQGRIYTA